MKRLQAFKYRNSRDILGTVKNITVSANGGKWFVSIQTEREIEPPVHPATHIVGIEDLPVRNMSKSAAGTHRSDLNAAQCRV